MQENADRKTRGPEGSSTQDVRAAGQTSKLSQPLSRMSSADSQRTQPFTASTLRAPKQQTELEQAIAKTQPVASLSETSLTSTAISDAAKMAASIKAAGVNLSDLDVDEGLTRSTADEDITAGRDEAETADQGAQVHEGETTKSNPQSSTAAESETENIADITMSVEVSSDEDDWPAYVEDPNLTDEQNEVHKQAFIESIKRRDAAATEVLQETKASKDKLVHTLARRIANDLRGGRPTRPILKCPIPTSAHTARRAYRRYTRRQANRVDGQRICGRPARPTIRADQCSRSMIPRQMVSQGTQRFPYTIHTCAASVLIRL